MTLMFEFGSWEAVADRSGLKLQLYELWQQYSPSENEVEFEGSEDHQNGSFYQPFLQFDGNKIRARNYVGFIQNDRDLIEIYPKVFKKIPDIHLKKELMLRHIFFWFSYCRKWRFPFNFTSLDTLEIENFPELIINLIANQFVETISSQPLTMYHPVEECLQTPKGSINFKRYITNSFTRGNFHQIECDYEPFLFDNKVNRIIKYCSRLLMNLTKFSENLRILQEVVFILDEVDDTPCTLADVERISLNSFFDDYSNLMNACRLILSQQLYSSNSYDFSQWCLLFPMEYIFEDFLAGFLQRNFSTQWTVEYQKSDEYLVNTPKAFKMQHDIVLTAKDGTNRKLIIDTKYKLRSDDFKSDKKRGVSQSDLYQMVSYAFKRGVTDIVLVYPNISEIINPPDNFEIISGFEINEVLNITAIELPFWSLANFSDLEKTLNDKLNRLLSFSVEVEL